MHLALEDRKVYQQSVNLFFAREVYKVRGRCIDLQAVVWQVVM